MNRNTILKTMLSLCAYFIFLLNAKAQTFYESENYIQFNKSDNTFALAENKTVAPILISSSDNLGISKITNLFAEDINKVFGLKPEIVTDHLPSTKTVVIIGTLGKSKWIDKLVDNKKIDVSDLKNKWETSLIQVVDKPFKGIDKALIIVGSDKRGTIYGMFDISRRIGVSPWHWWADAATKKHSAIYVKHGRYNLGEPAVKYRGIFLNDEEPALGRWAVEKYGGFRHQMYEKVFELILRLKGNYLWPAMWWASFNSDDPENKKLAHEMGIVMGTSHHEPMMRAWSEWKAETNGEWNFSTNAENLKKFWRKGIKRMNGYESIVTLAMRGDGDQAMSEDTNTKLLEEIVKEQRKILTEVTGKKIEEIPQIWALYKEVQNYYDKGMRVPDDVTLLLCDDNWGNIRFLPKTDSPKRKGGYGMYYHFDFVGGPRNYKWLNTSPLPRVWEQMNLTYRYGVDKIWLANVGDLKPMELPISFFLDFAWNPDEFPYENVENYHKLWAQEQFGKENAEEIGEILRKYPKYNARRKPEMLFSDTYSLLNYREFERISRDYNQLEQKASKLFNSMSKQNRSAFYQLVYHPVEACNNLYQLYLAHAKNQLYAKQKRSSTNTMAQKVQFHFAKDSFITNYYHSVPANGKWNNMMNQTHIGYTNWQQPKHNYMPKVTEIELPEKANAGVSAEGTKQALTSKNTATQFPDFDSYNRQNYYFEVFNKGKKPFPFRAFAENDWVKLSETKGTIQTEKRIYVSIDWDKIKVGEHQSEIVINANSKIFKINILAKKYKAEKQNAKGFIENNGCVSMEAPNYSSSKSIKPFTWVTYNNLGRTLGGVSSLPLTKGVEKLTDDSPYLEYRFYLLEKPKNGIIKALFYVSPTLNFLKGKGLRFAVSIDDEPAQIINIHDQIDSPDWEYPEWWGEAVGNACFIKASEHKVTEAGQHSIKYRLLDPGIVLQKIVLDTGGLKPSYLGPPESKRIK